MGGKVGENPAALRAAVFLLSSKNLRGPFKRPPQQGAGINANINIYLGLRLPRTQEPGGRGGGGSCPSNLKWGEALPLQLEPGDLPIYFWMINTASTYQGVISAHKL